MPDMDRSWGRAMIACAATLISSAVHSTSGFFYVEFMREYSLNHKTASWPTSVSQAMTEGSALIAVALQAKIGISTLGLIGSVLFWSGIIVSQWAPNVAWMTFTFGVVQGTGSGIVGVAVTVLLMRLFDKYRATATGIRYAGYSLSSLIYPSMLSLMDTIFSFSQLFLLLGAVSMNVTPLVYALREPALERKSPRVKKQREHKISKHKTRADSVRLWTTLVENTNDTNRQALHCEAGRDEGALQNLGSEDRNSKIALSVAQKCTECRGCEQGTRSTVINNSMDAQPKILQGRITVHVNGDSKSLNSDRKTQENPVPLSALLLRPAFWVVVLGAAVADYSDYVFLATIVDSALDRGATTFQADMSITCCAPAQLFGRTVLPFVADLGFANRTTLTSACYFLLAASIALLGATRTFSAYAPFAAVACISIGFLTTMKHVVGADHFGVEAVPVVWATSVVFVLPMLFCNPSILGFIRDKHGSYNSLYYFLGCLHLVMGVAFLILRCSALKRKKRWTIQQKNKKPGANSSELWPIAATKRIWSLLETR